MHQGTWHEYIKSCTYNGIRIPGNMTYNAKGSGYIFKYITGTSQYIYIYIHTHIYIHIHTCIHAYINTYIHSFKEKHTYTHTCIYPHV